MSQPKIWGLFVGINYPGTSSELGGCVNDAKDMHSLLTPYIESQCDVLLDADATKANIVDALKMYIEGLKPQDLLIFHYSGHGTWIPDKDGDEPDHRDECLCPIDYESGLLIDDELAEIFSQKTRGSRILFLSDSCHSGSVFRMGGNPSWNPSAKIKFIPPEAILKGKQAERAETTEQKHIASTVIRKTGGMSNKATSGVVHFAGCQDTEYSYDASFGGKANGAFTRNFIDVYKSLPMEATFGDMMKELKNYLPSYEYPQRPKLNGTTADRRRVLPGKEAL